VTESALEEHDIELIHEDRLAFVLDFLHAKTDLHDFDGMLDRIRDGDRQALAEYGSYSLQLSNTATWDGWTGPESPDTICHALNTMVAQAEMEWTTSSTPPPPASTTPDVIAQPACPEPPDRDLSLASDISGILHQISPRETAPTTKGPIAAPPITPSCNGPAADDSPPSTGIRWREYARSAGFDTKWLSSAAQEILDMISRVLIAGKGWGISDAQRGQHKHIEFSPSRMSRHGQKRNRRTYQRQCTHLIDLGLLLEVERRPNGALVVAPGWWAPHYTSDAIAVWIEAARRYRRGLECRTRAAVMSQSDPQNVAPMSHPPVRTQIDRIHNDNKEFGDV